jgi:nuclear pore complex protein Nup133
MYRTHRKLNQNYSWNMIRKTANVSDVELNERFRGTALYATLCAIISEPDRSEGYETQPDVALMTPSVAEISSRWPGLSLEETEALVQDYNLECDRLGELDLNDVYHRVRELALHDVVWRNTS